MDFPAAHSMDTEWFALDGDGHVATLYSNEEGEVPEIAATELTIPDLFELLAAEHKVSCELGDFLARPPAITLKTVVSISESAKAKELGKEEWVSRDAKNVVTSRSFPVSAENQGEVLQASVIRNEQTRERAVNLWSPLFACTDAEKTLQNFPVSTGAAPPVKLKCEAALDFDLLYVPDRVDIETLLKLFEMGLITRGWPHLDTSLWRFGLFEYKATLSFEYTFRVAPVRPLQESELPARVQEQITSVRFSNVSFASGEPLYPRLHYRCRGWNEER